MKPEKVFKRYDIRGKHPEEIDAEFAQILGKSVGTWALENSTAKVLVTKDTKDTSKELKQELIKALKSTGVNVFDAGTGPTDYTALNASAHDAVGVQVTSSHLPVEFNGFKLIYPEGNGFVNEDLYEVQDIFRSREFEEQRGSVKEVESSCHERYRQRASQYFRKFFEGIDKTVVYDSMGGAGHIFLPDLLEEFGAELIDLSKTETVQDPPKPEPENLEHVVQKYEDSNADIALVNDMDADRLAVYHEDEWIDGNELFSVFAQVLQPENIVASIDTSNILEKSFEGVISYTRVGDPFVISEALRLGADLSGEPNGHYGFTEFTPYNSGTMAGLLIAASDLRNLRENVPEFANQKKSFNVEDKDEALNRVIEEVGSRYEVVSEVDGVKFKVGEAHVLVRSSGSSQKLRAVSDAETRAEAVAGIKAVQKII
jgi:phosphomannomutase/phosphoglucomutase